MHRISSLRGLAVSVVALLVASTTASAGAKILSSWKAPDIGPLSFAGKKVAALVITRDQSLQISAEEALARELSARGVQGVAAYKLVPREELEDPQKVRGWFERAVVEGVVALRLVNAETQRSYSPVVWTSPYYSSFWGYYGYGWTTVYSPVSVREDTVLTIETLIFSVPQDKLVWAGTSETTNPSGAGQVVSELTKAIVKEMKKQGLVRK